MGPNEQQPAAAAPVSPVLDFGDELLGRFERIDSQLAVIRKELMVQWVAIVATAALVIVSNLRARHA